MTDFDKGFMYALNMLKDIILEMNDTEDVGISTGLMAVYGTAHSLEVRKQEEVNNRVK